MTSVEGREGKILLNCMIVVFYTFRNGQEGNVCFRLLPSYPFIYSLIYLSTPINLSIHSLIYPPVHPSPYPPMHLHSSMYQFIIHPYICYQSIHLLNLITPFIHLSILLCTHPPIQPPIYIYLSTPSHLNVYPSI